MRILQHLLKLKYCKLDEDEELSEYFKKLTSSLNIHNVFNPSFYCDNNVKIFAFRAIPNGNDWLTSFISIEDKTGRSVKNISIDLYEELNGARYAPYGYRYNKEKKLLEVDEQEAKVVKLIYTMFLCDKSIFAITEYLTKKGYRNRKGNIFSTKLIGDILKNRIYTGKLVWNKHYYDKTQKTKKGYRYIKNPPDKIIISQGKHQPIVPDDDFETVQEKLKTRKVEGRKKANDYPLSGILYCAKCNHKYLGISSISNHRTGVKKRWYRCAGPYRSFIRCKNKSVKANEIESEVAEILKTLLKNGKLKTSRWTNVTPAEIASSAASPPPRNDEGVKILKNRLENNLKKQSKLTDAYLENLLSEELYKQKNEGLRNEEEELKKLIALQEVREIERERSKDYLSRVEEFLESYDPNKKVMDKETKKLILNLLFKNIKIAPKSLFSFNFFAPFNFFFFEEKQKCQVVNLQRVMKNRPRRSSSVLSDVRWKRCYIPILHFLEEVYNSS